MQVKAKYPETEFRKLETKLADAEQELAYWKRVVPSVFAKDFKIHELEQKVKVLEFRVT